MKEYLSIITLLEYNQKLANVLKTIRYFIFVIEIVFCIDNVFC